MPKAEIDLPAKFGALRERLDLETALPENRSGLTEWIQDRLVQIIMDATDAADINRIAEESGLTPSKSLTGHTLEIQDFVLLDSAEAFSENSYLKKYVIIKAIDSSGEAIVVDGGGDMFVAQLVAMRDRYGFPFIGTIVGRPTQAGYEMLYWRMHQPKTDKPS